VHPGTGKVNILVIEDDAATATYVSTGLTELGHNITLAADGREGLFQASDHEWDLILVDRMLPGLDGLVLVSTLRATGNQAPILFLTTLGGIDDRVTGLNAGADDYLVKPFAFSELAARVAALGRRPRKTQSETTLRVGDLEMDLISRRVTRSRSEVELQPREFRLLEVLMRHAGEVVTRTMLLEKVWDLHFDPQTNVVESHMSRLRGKVERSGQPNLIHTVRGAGYSIKESGP